MLPNLVNKYQNNQTADVFRPNYGKENIASERGAQTGAATK